MTWNSLHFPYRQCSMLFGIGCMPCAHHIILNSHFCFYHSHSSLVSLIWFSKIIYSHLVPILEHGIVCVAHAQRKHTHTHCMPRRNGKFKTNTTWESRPNGKSVGVGKNLTHRSHIVLQCYRHWRWAFWNSQFYICMQIIWRKFHHGISMVHPNRHIRKHNFTLHQSDEVFLVEFNRTFRTYRCVHVKCGSPPTSPSSRFEIFQF